MDMRERKKPNGKKGEKTKGKELPVITQQPGFVTMPQCASKLPHMKADDSLDMVSMLAIFGGNKATQTMCLPQMHYDSWTG